MPTLATLTDHTPGHECRGAHHPDHVAHDQWHLVYRPGRVWCRTCAVEFALTFGDDTRFAAAYELNGPWHALAVRPTDTVCPGDRTVAVCGATVTATDIPWNDTTTRRGRPGYCPACHDVTDEPRTTT